MERLGNTGPSGLHTGSLRAWGMLFAVAGIVSRSILQNQMLGVGLRNMEELKSLMDSSDTAMIIATIALVLQAMETVAVPIFAFLLAEGFAHTSDWKKYLLRVAGLAVLTEIPYDLAINGKVLEFGNQNPVLGIALCLVLLYLFTHFAGKKLMCVIVALAAAIWAVMLKIEHGVPMVLMICIIYLFRNKRMFMGFSGVAVAAMCTAISPFYLLAPMGFLAIHFYNGEKGNSSRLVNYLFYPVSLLIIGLVVIFAF
ncbi:MAG: hypothetical protein IKB09_07790 [Oscillospiraceae bacterium]|nr:hypothetical protein [Oscillospiraceae bacterium]